MTKPIRWQDAKPTPLDDILRIARELPSRPQRPPLSTEDALRQIATTGSEDAKRLARAELKRRGAVADGQLLAETIECPICKAPIGKPCEIISGNGLHIGRHSVRENDARRAAASKAEAVTP